MPNVKCLARFSGLRGALSLGQSFSYNHVPVLFSIVVVYFCIRGNDISGVAWSFVLVNPEG